MANQCHGCKNNNAFSNFVTLTSINAAIISLSVFAFLSSFMQWSKSIATEAISGLYLGSNAAIILCLLSISSELPSQQYVTRLSVTPSRREAMDLESVFDGPLSSGSSGKKSGVSVTVWQAEVALRLSELHENNIRHKRVGLKTC